MKKGGKRPWECCFDVHLRHINYLKPQCIQRKKVYKGKKKLMVATRGDGSALEFDLCNSEL